MKFVLPPVSVPQHSASQRVGYRCWCDAHATTPAGDVPVSTKQRWRSALGKGDQIGSGAFGTVFLALDRDCDMIAVKEVRLVGLQDYEARAPKEITHDLVAPHQHCAISGFRLLAASWR